MVEFIHTEQYILHYINSTVYVGPNPFDDCVRKKIRGRQVLHEGKVKTIIAIESFAKVQEPKLGEIIGLMFKYVD